MTAPRRILLLTPGFPPNRGGIERTAGELAAGLGPEHEVSVVTGRPAAGALPAAPQAFRVHWTRNDPPYGRQATAALIAGAIAVGVRRRPDVVLCLHIRAMPAARALQRLTGARAVLVVHAKEIGQQPSLGAAAVRWADGIVTVSRFSRDLALAAGAPPQRTTIINPGVTLPTGPVVAVRERAGPTVILAVARMADRHKGHDLLIEALSLLRAQQLELHAMFIGDGPLRADLERLASARGVSDLITFAGSVDDRELRAQLGSAHLFCLPTRVPAGGAAGEGFGIAFVEAAAYGLPVIGGRVPGVVDAVQDGVTGLLVDPGEPSAVAAALARVANDPALAARLGSAGQGLAVRLAWPEVVTRYLEWFDYISSLPARRERSFDLRWVRDLARGPDGQVRRGAPPTD